VSKGVASGGPAPSGLSEQESRAWERLIFVYTKGIGYATEMALRPQTLYGLADSPVALAACVKGVSVPAAVSVFPRELYQAPRAWAERAYPNLIYFNEVDQGNHFAAW